MQGTECGQSTQGYRLLQVVNHVRQHNPHTELVCLVPRAAACIVHGMWHAQAKWQGSTHRSSDARARSSSSDCATSSADDCVLSSGASIISMDARRGLHGPAACSDVVAKPWGIRRPCQTP